MRLIMYLVKLITNLYHATMFLLHIIFLVVYPRDWWYGGGNYSVYGGVVCGWS